MANPAFRPRGCLRHPVPQIIAKTRRPANGERHERLSDPLSPFLDGNRTNRAALAEKLTGEGFAPRIEPRLSKEMQSAAFHRDGQVVAVSTKYRCHRLCHLQMSLLSGRGRGADGRGARRSASRPTGARCTGRSKLPPLGLPSERQLARLVEKLRGRPERSG